jgi:hypothetical protein
MSLSPPEGRKIPVLIFLAALHDAQRIVFTFEEGI